MEQEFTSAGQLWAQKLQGLYSSFMHRLTAIITLGYFKSFHSPSSRNLPGLPGLVTLENFPKKDLAEVLVSEKLIFLAEYGNEYGYPEGTVSVDELRSSEFSRLNGKIYVDHAGATLHADSQLKAAMDDLSANLYGNPHSQSESSIRTSDEVESARQQVLDLCNAPAGKYKCVYTSGATAALKLVGEAFPWSSESEYLYTMDNHNSVLGLREYALDHGATVTAVDVEWACPSFNSGVSEGGHDVNLKRRNPQKRSSLSAAENDEEEVYNLFAFPLECNFSGVKFDLNLVNWVQQGKHFPSPQRDRWMVLLDAAKGCGTLPPDLSRFPADFVAISFYKIFGYPTGLGALIVRNDAANLLKKRYFGGGTVAVSIADADFMQKRERVEHWLEDGSVSFLAIAALRHGFAAINRLETYGISRHTGSLTSYTATKLAALQHGNGAPVCVLYGNHSTISSHHAKYWGQHCNQGPILTFNMKRADGSWVGHREVEKLAALSNIQLRTGCFCNPGACAKYLGLSQMDLRLNFEAGHVCWDDHDVINGRPTGAVRLSFGYMSSFEDCLAVIQFICKYFVETKVGLRNSAIEKEGKLERSMLRSIENLEFAESNMEGRVGSYKGKSDGDEICTSPIHVESMAVYPIKSCAGFTVDVWPLSDCGLLYDREWLIRSLSGDTLTQKKLPSLFSIRPSIDLLKGMMHVSAPNVEQQLVIPLDEVPKCGLTGDVLLCGERAEANTYGAEVTQWFTKALGVPCSLVRREPKSRQIHPARRNPTHLGFKESDAVGNAASELSFANEGQFLLVSKPSVEELNRRIAASRTTFLGEDWQRKESGATEHGQIFQVDALRFRPNLVVSGGVPYDEDNWKTIGICDETFTVLGGCNRCQMVNVDQATGCRQLQSQPLATLASYRRIKGKIMFGILLVHGESGLLSPEQTLPAGLETAYTKWLRARYGRLLSVGCKLNVERQVA